MANVWANTLNETEKLWRRGRTKLIMALAVLLPAISSMLLALLRGSPVVSGWLGSSVPLLMLGAFTSFLLPLFVCLAAADSFSGEVASRTLKLVLTRPISRPAVFASKVLAIAGALAAALAALWIASAAAEALTPGLGESADSLLESIPAYAAAFVPMIAIALISACVAQWSNSSSGTIVLLLLVYAAAKLIPFVFPAFAVWSLFSYTDWHVLWIGSAAPASKLFSAFALLLAYCIIAYTAGLIAFERKQL